MFAPKAFRKICSIDSGFVGLSGRSNDNQLVGHISAESQLIKDKWLRSSSRDPLLPPLTAKTTNQATTACSFNDLREESDF